MKNYKVRTINKYNEKGFNDLEEKVWRNVGDEFYCTQERYEFLSSKGAVELIDINNEEIKDEEPAFMQPTIVCHEKKRKIDKKKKK